MRRTLLPEALQTAPFAVRDGRGAGLTGAGLRSPALVAPFRGVRLASAADGFAGRCAALMLLLPDGSRLTGVSGATLHGLPVGSVDPAVPYQIRVPPGHRVRRRGVAVLDQTAAQESAAVVDGVPVDPAALCWVQCAADARLSEVDLVVLADAVATRETSLDGLSRAVQQSTRVAAARRAAAVLSSVRVGSASPQETRLRLALLAARVPEPELNADVTDPSGWIATPDLVWRSVRTAVEYDGEHHRTDPTQWNRDITRKRLLEDAGWRCIVLTAADLQGGGQRAVGIVSQALRQRGLNW